MNVYAVIIGFIVLALGGGYLAMQGSGEMTNDEMMKDEMHESDARESDLMMKRDETTEKDAMMNKEETMMEDSGSVMETDAMMAHGGTYEAYAANKIAWANTGDVVLFFRASWCPTCKAVDADIRGKRSSIPKNLTILDVNYDTETALKQKYGVTYQHMFVQVDADGNQIQKWSGSPTLAALVTEVQ